MKKIDKISKADIERIFSESKSQATVADKLGYSKISGSINNLLKAYARDNNIDTSHFTGQG